MDGPVTAVFEAVVVPAEAVQIVRCRFAAGLEGVPVVDVGVDGRAVAAGESARAVAAPDVVRQGVGRGVSAGVAGRWLVDEL